MGRPRIDITQSPGMDVCDRCERIKPVGWFGCFWLCDQCTLIAVEALTVEAAGRAIERLIAILKQRQETSREEQSGTHAAA